MTVAKLIELLKTYPQDAVVMAGQIPNSNYLTSNVEVLYRDDNANSPSGFVEITGEDY